MSAGAAGRASGCPCAHTHLWAAACRAFLPRTTNPPQKPIRPHMHPSVKRSRGHIRGAVPQRVPARKVCLIQSPHVGASCMAGPCAHAHSCTQHSHLHQPTFGGKPVQLATSRSTPERRGARGVTLFSHRAAAQLGARSEAPRLPQAPHQQRIDQDKITKSKRHLALSDWRSLGPPKARWVPQKLISAAGRTSGRRRRNFCPKKRAAGRGATPQTHSPDRALPLLRFGLWALGGIPASERADSARGAELNEKPSRLPVTRRTRAAARAHIY